VKYQFTDEAASDVEKILAYSVDTNKVVIKNTLVLNLTLCP
jgi:plasmid stabilization system protein ParE